MEKNIFIKALEFGEKNIEIGISFNELIEFLKHDINKKFQNDEEKKRFINSFNVWFYDNFFLREIQKTRAGIREIPSLELMKTHNVNKAMLTGEAFFKLIEFKELNEARKSSKKAFWIATIATLLTFISILVQIYCNS